MKPRSAVISVCLPLCIGWGVPAHAQVPSASVSPIVLRANADTTDFGLSDGFTMRRKVQEAQIRFVATDSTGKPVLGLHPEDVRVFDDKVRVPELKSFVLSQYQPLEVGVLVDLSESIGPQQQGETLLAADLLGEIFDSRRDQAFVVGFANNVHLLQAETTDINLIKSALLNNPGRQGLTSLFDALVQTCRTEFAHERSPERQRILLLFSDGDDTLSFHTLEDAVREALRTEATIYAVTTADSGSDGFRNLLVLTEQTGGRIYSIPKKQDMNSLSVAMSQSVRGEYTISFRPTTMTAGFHPVRIELPTHQDVILRANSGYYMGPQ